MFSVHLLKELDYLKMYDSMLKPAFIFDGRKMLNHEKLLNIGFHVETIGSRVTHSPILRGWAAVTRGEQNYL